MMKKTVSVLGSVAVAAALVLPANAGGPCVPAWSNLPGIPGVASGYIADLQLWNDGTSTAMYATGNFTGLGGAADTARIAKWTGSGWTPLGTGLQNQFSNALASFNGQLYVGGYFDSAGGVTGTNKFARWDGAAWHSVNAQMDNFQNSVWALKTYDDGTGEALYVAGNYISINGQTISHLSRFDGTNYTAVGSGPIAGAGIPLIILELETWNDGTGDALYIGGRFTSVAGVPANRIAKWNGTTWTSLGTGITGTSTTGTSVNAIEPWDDGSGPSLFVAGQSVNNAGGVTVSRVARWDGTAWHDVGGGLNGTVWDLKVFDDGSGEALYAVGLFTMIVNGGVTANRVAKWDGISWSPVGGGATPDSVFCALPFNDGSGPALYIGGSFTAIDNQTAAGFARYEGCEAKGVPGDVNGDGSVNVADLLAVISSWGACPTPPAACPADVDHSGVVGVADLLMVIGNWG